MNALRPILIVDDCEDDLLLLKGVLIGMSLLNPIRTTTSGEEAIEYVLDGNVSSHRISFPKPILVMVDLRMQPTDGFEVLRRVRTVSRDDLAIIVTTGAQQAGEMGQAYRLGADGFLTKPVRSIDLQYPLHGIPGLAFEQMERGWALVPKSRPRNLSDQ